MLIEQLNVERFRGFVIPIIYPVGWVLDQRPEIVVQVEHEKTQTSFLQSLRQLHSGGSLARRTWPADPHHPQLVPCIEAGHYFGGRLIQ